ncbi:uncharacterized protein LOC141686855 [Apium graveolens]|uniref:uncharacterized protein LOC141686855 n=1 Tax=Apium graveolens TaxID=4045 RepID=UPI003D7A5399
MANNFEKFGFNQNALYANGFIGFHERSNDLPITTCPTVPYNNKSQGSFLMSSSPECHGFHEIYGDFTLTPFHEGQNEPSMMGSHKILTGFQDTTITHPIVQNINIGGNYTQMSDARSDTITFTCPPTVQNGAPFISESFKIWGGKKHIRSSHDNFNSSENTSNTSRNLSRSANKVHPSRTARQYRKRVRFRFVMWSKEEEDVMDRELLKCTSLPAKNIPPVIAKLLPKKSVRDVTMRIQSLIVHKKMDDIWSEGAPKEDLSSLNFYLPDNPNDPDFFVIQNMLHPQAIKRRRV